MRPVAIGSDVFRVLMAVSFIPKKFFKLPYGCGRALHGLNRGGLIGWERHYGNFIKPHLLEVGNARRIVGLFDDRTEAN